MAKSKDHKKQGKGQGNRSIETDSVRSMLHNQRFDKILLVAVGVLLMAGILMVFSASNAVSRDGIGDSYHFVKMQMLWCCIGLSAMVFTTFFNYRNYKWLTWPLLILSAFLLWLVLVPGVGIEHGGGTRWIRVGKFSFQPVEFVKLAVVIFMARFLDQKRDCIRSFWHGILPCLLVLSVLFAMIHKQPDFGSLVLMGLIVFAMLFAGGARVYQVALLMIVAGLLAYVAIRRVPYRWARWTAFLDPWADPEGTGYHIIQSFYALGAGGVLGTGLGAGVQKLHYLPTPHTDFIFAVIGEELGFVGSLSIITLFMVIVWRGMRISLSIQDRFGSLLALGIAFLIGIQAIINIGVVTGSLPTKGLTLPFISFGGSSMLISLIAVGILLNISKGKSLETSV